MFGWDVFFWITVVPMVGHFHAIRLTNSVAHMWGYRPYRAQFQWHCKAANNWWVALLNGGEGWHNNHHAFMTSCKHGFMWWEVDWVYWGLCILGKLGIVWDCKVVTREVKDARYKHLDQPGSLIHRFYRLEFERPAAADGWPPSITAPPALPQPPSESLPVLVPAAPLVVLPAVLPAAPLVPELMD